MWAVAGNLVESTGLQNTSREPMLPPPQLIFSFSYPPELFSSALQIVPSHSLAGPVETIHTLSSHDICSSSIHVTSTWSRNARRYGISYPYAKQRPCRKQG